VIVNIHPFLNFNGDANEAIALYQSALGAKVSVIMRWSELPADAMPPGAEIPPEVADKVMYAKLEIGGGALELSDVPSEMTVEPGSMAFVAVQCGEPEEVDRMVAALAEGGTIEMPVDDMFWGARYGKVRDRFGISWTFNCPTS
jgi:PhnB protein